MTKILTYTGKSLDYLNPSEDQIDILDIAYGLSREARFNGQTDKFYSVAQHSYICSMLVPREYAKEALLHDATEAYMKDIPRPLKNLLPDYKHLEYNLETVIRRKFGLPEIKSEAVKRADLILLLTEYRDLKNFILKGEEFKNLIPLSNTIRPCNPNHALGLFTSRWMGLIND